MEDKFKFCDKLHKKHHEEVKQYEELADNMDKDKFNKKIKRATFQLQTDAKNYGKSIDQMKSEIENTKIYLERA